MLIGSPFVDGARTLTLENRLTGKETVVKTYDRDIGVAWSPDSRAFSLADALGSNMEDAYVYWPGKEEPFLLNDPILESDPQAAKLPVDHTYFRIHGWWSTNSLVVEYCGHTSDESPVDGHSPDRFPVQFSFVYRVTLTGADPPVAVVRRLRHWVRPFSFSRLDCE